MGVVDGAGGGAGGWGWWWGWWMRLVGVVGDCSWSCCLLALLFLAVWFLQAQADLDT